MKCLIFSLLLFGAAAAGQAPVAPLGSGLSPREVVEQLWIDGSRGDLLEKEGWDRASRLYVEPNPPTDKKVIEIRSDNWGVQRAKVNDDTAEVIVNYEHLGHLDSALRFVREKGDPGIVGTGVRYRLIFAVTHSTMFKADRKTVLREVPGPTEWRIKDPMVTRWITVDGAIHYLLLIRETTTDPNLKTNADQSLSALIHLQ